MLQVAFYTSDRVYVEDIAEMQDALKGSEYTLDVEQTNRNGGIAMINVNDKRVQKLMREGEVHLPSGYIMEIPTP